MSRVAVTDLHLDIFQTTAICHQRQISHFVNAKHGNDKFSEKVNLYEEMRHEMKVLLDFRRVDRNKFQHKTF